LTSTSIFIRRAGRSTMHVRVFHARPRAKAAARAMRRRGIPLSHVCWCLGIKRERIELLTGAHALFKF